ncbi:MAG: SAM-dependent methyltransferase [Bacteroidetes bacterium]|nr:MAG: SAM-dependent methyltransferase [Bacteroidota bacterium]
MDQAKIIITDDGSHTLKVEELSEHYHSTFGAVSESKHVFIEAGLQKVLEAKRSDISILEIGFGTALNAFLTVLEMDAQSPSIHYYGIEAYPLEEKLWRNLNYPDILSDKGADELFYKLHQSEWGEACDISKGFILHKIHQKLQDYQHHGKLIDLVYFDAFGPDVQPELWTPEIFKKIADITSPGGILVTYSCKGSVRRALKEAGFVVEKIPGPKGKREMARGVRC